MSTSSLPGGRRAKRRLVVPLLAAAIAAACIVAPAAAAAAPPARAQHAAASSAPWSQIVKLLGSMWVRSKPVVSRGTIQVVKYQARRWTRQELANWYCGQWGQYFSYDRSLWYRAALQYYWPNFAWRYCTAVGYL
jgi:hypothetical protein